MTHLAVKGGWLDGSWIIKAKKDHSCDYWHGMPEDPMKRRGNCKNTIKAGSLYVEGDPNETAGGFGRDRYCYECVGDEARKSIKKAKGET